MTWRELAEIEERKTVEVLLEMKGGIGRKRNKKREESVEFVGIFFSSERAGEGEDGGGKQFGGGRGGEEDSRDDGKEGYSGVGRGRRVEAVGEWLVLMTESD